MIDAAAAAGVSKRTAYNWLARWRAGGETGPPGPQLGARPLAEPAGRPRLSPRSSVCVASAGAVRASRARLGQPVSTVGTGAAPARPGPPERPRGQAAGGALRAQCGLANCSTSTPRSSAGSTAPATASPATARGHRARGLGWEYLHVAIDDASRLAYTELLPDERGPSCAGFLARAAAWFASLGVRHRAGHDRQRLRLHPQPELQGGPHRARCPPPDDPALHAHAPTARPSASSRPRCANGYTPSLTPAPRHAPPTCPTGSTGTTTTDLMPASTPLPLPAD